jgi:hypothetical protein
MPANACGERDVYYESAAVSPIAVDAVDASA